MPYETNPHTRDFDPNQELPQHLQHKPVFALPYQFFDGLHAGTGTDMRFISVGMAQYNPEEVSLKAMRCVNGRWSGQAEELPLHRPIDMALFLAKVLFDSDDGSVLLPAGTLKGKLRSRPKARAQDQANDITVTLEERDPEELEAFDAFIQQHAPELRGRFNALLDVLTDLKARGRL